MSSESESEFDSRLKMKKFWEQYDASPKSMMMCSAANDVLEDEDRSQVLRVCPSLHGKTVLELGAGIGRFTTELAKVSASVTAVDFIESYVEKNRKTNSHYENVEFLAADVTELELPPESKTPYSYDVIFSNWLLMYLSNEEVSKLVVKMLSWLKDGGYLFVRESCCRPSGDVKRETNPTYYRSPDEYFKILQRNIYFDRRGQEYAFVCHRALSMEAYIRHYGNPFQLGFVLKKVGHTGDSYNTFQAFLDGNQYSLEGIRRYEFIFGKTYVSTGGHSTTDDFVKKLNLESTDVVLDVGCGIGGSAFHMAREYGVTVHGVDLSTNMISIAIKYQAEMEDSVRKNVSFEMNDITKADFKENSFDVIYTRDTMLHIEDKEELFTNFLKWLKPGGRLMISDYCHGDKLEYSEDFLEYIHQRGYRTVMKVADYGRLLEMVGFESVVAEDKTPMFIDTLNSELERFEKQEEEFLARFSKLDFSYLVDGWHSKLKRSSAGDQTWGLFTAVKPL